MGDPALLARRRCCTPITAHEKTANLGFRYRQLQDIQSTYMYTQVHRAGDQPPLLTTLTYETNHNTQYIHGQRTRNAKKYKHKQEEEGMPKGKKAT